MNNKTTKQNSAKSTYSQKTKTITTNKIGETLEYVLVNIFCLLIFVAFGYISIMSLLQTSVIDSANYANEIINYESDNFFINIFFIVLFFAFLFAMKNKYDFFAKLDIKVFETALPVYVAVIGLIWVFSAASVPAADSQNLFEAATGAVNGDYSSFIDGANFYNKEYYGGYSYFNFYPFQLGFVFISECVYRIFGTSSAMPIEVLNVFCTALAYLAIAKITKHLFNKLSIEFFSIMLLAGCFQPILLCTFAYGNIIGMCCALWAAYFLIRYFKSKKCLLLLPCVALLTVSTLAKYNNLIYVAAFVIMLLIHTIKAKKWQSIAFALAICIATVGASNLVIMSYEKRADVELSDGVSQVLYLDMGLSESYMAPGWYNDIAKSTYLEKSFNNEAANKKAWADIKNRSYAFSNTDYTIDFFGKKILSQWNEPTFESIWVSKVKSHYYELNGIANGMYSGSLGQFFELYFNWYIQILYLLFAVGIYCLFLNKKTDITTVLLPLVILGGFGYHLLFEGKSQYVLTYIPLMIPTASYAIYSILNGKYEKIREIIKKLKEIPEPNKTK